MARKRTRKSSQPVFLNDQPSHDDHLDFEPYRQTLREIINDERTETPLTIGVFGTWGTGKSTLLNMVMGDLEREETSLGRRNVTVWFDAWKYDREDSLWRALLLRVVAAVREALKDDAEAQQELQELEDSLYHEVSREELGSLQFDWAEFAKAGAKTGLHVLATLPALGLPAKAVEELLKKVTGDDPAGLLDAFKRAHTEVKIAQVQFLEQFQERFRKLVSERVHPHGHLVVFVDDLDRCAPEKAIQVLEAIKLFLDAPGCVFVLGVDRGVIERGIRVKYRELAGEIDGAKYLEKIIQMPFDLPPLEEDDIKRYVHSLTPGLADQRCEAIFASGLREPNPRQIKRSINVFLLLSRLARARVKRLGKLSDLRLAKIVVIQQSHSDLYNTILRFEPGLLAELEAYLHARGSIEKREDPEAAPLPELPERLQPFTGEALSRLLLLFQDDPVACFRDLTSSGIRPYITLAKAVSAPAPAVTTRPRYEPATVIIPAGDFFMGTSDEDVKWLIEHTDWARDFEGKGYFEPEKQQFRLELPEYAMGRYPVTNREYQAFVEATGYAPPRHWNGATAPDEIGDHPVVYVSLDDTLAYCAWLASLTGKNYRLPSEAEWEKAARGGVQIPEPNTGALISSPSPGRHWPWGNEFDPAKCNTSEGGKGGTTPVGDYSPLGDSPYGCADMAGNVWEWTRSQFRDYPYDPSDGREDEGAGADVRLVVRGGSWFPNRGLARCAFRFRYYPDYRGYGVGFRVRVAPPT